MNNIFSIDMSQILHGMFKFNYGLLFVRSYDLTFVWLKNKLLLLLSNIILYASMDLMNHEMGGLPP